MLKNAFGVLNYNPINPLIRVIRDSEIEEVRKVRKVKKLEGWNVSKFKNSCFAFLRLCGEELEFFS